MIGFAASGLVTVVFLLLAGQYTEVGLLGLIVAYGALAVAILGAVMLLVLHINAGIEAASASASDRFRDYEREQKTQLDRLGEATDEVGVAVARAAKHADSFYSLSLSLVLKALPESENVEVWSLESVDRVRRGVAFARRSDYRSSTGNCHQMHGQAYGGDEEKRRTGY